jgi:hypothetical protein
MLEMIRCWSCTFFASTCTRDRERKSACFWLSPSSTTLSPLTDEAFECLDYLRPGQDRAFHPVLNLLHAPLFLIAPRRPGTRYLLTFAVSSDHSPPAHMVITHPF